MLSTKDTLKREFFELRDILEELENSSDCVNKRDIKIAITHLETAQMWSVRSLFTEEQVRSH